MPFEKYIPNPERIRTFFRKVIRGEISTNGEGLPLVEKIAPPTGEPPIQPELNITYPTVAQASKMAPRRRARRHRTAGRRKVIRRKKRVGRRKSAAQGRGRRKRRVKKSRRGRSRKVERKLQSAKL